MLVTQLCLTLSDPMDCSLPGSSVHGILQARILEWVAISFSRGSSQPKDWNLGLLHCRQFLYHWASREACFINTFLFIVFGPITSWQIDGETVRDFIFWVSKITVDGDCSHEIKRHLLFGRKVMTNLDSILKSRDITLSTKDCLFKAMFFPVVMYECESWTKKKAEHWRIDAFEL